MSTLLYAVSVAIGKFVLEALAFPRLLGYSSLFGNRFRLTAWSLTWGRGRIEVDKRQTYRWFFIQECLLDLGSVS